MPVIQLDPANTVSRQDCAATRTPPPRPVTRGSRPPGGGGESGRARGVGVGVGRQTWGPGGPRPITQMDSNLSHLGVDVGALPRLPDVFSCMGGREGGGRGGGGQLWLCRVSRANCGFFQAARASCGCCVSPAPPPPLLYNVRIVVRLG